MAFSLSGTTITQTGTDTSLAGLSGIAGVTTSTFFGVVTVFNIGNYRLVINGTLSFNAELQALQIGTGAAFPNIEVAGVFDIGLLQSKAYTASQNPAGGSFTRVQRRPAVVCNRISPSTFLTTEASLQVNSGGVCRMYGTTLLHGGTIHCVAGSTFEAFDGMLYCIASRHRWFYSAVGGTRLYLGGDDATNGGVLNLVGTSVQYIGIEPDQVDLVYSRDSTLRNFVSNRCVTIDHRVDNASVTLSLNPLNGSDCRFNVSENPANNRVQNTGGLLVKREVNVQVTDSGGAPIQNCKVVVPYTDDGNRRDGLGQTITTLISESGVTNLSGAVSLNVLLAAWIRTTAGVAGIANQGLNAPTYLNKNGNGTADLFDIRFFSYGYMLSENTNVSLRGQNALQINRIILSDASITNVNKSSVDAYTSIDTSAKFYDRAKSWLFDNYAGQTATLVTRSGNVINAGSYNVIIDAAAPSVFSIIAGTTIVIKASTYTGDMTTAGIITLANGATFIGTRTDANGTTATASVTITNGVTGTRLLIQNVTNPAAPVTLYSNIPASFPYTWTGNVSGAATIDIRVRAAYQSGTTAKMFVDEEIGTLSVVSPSLSYRLNQVNDAVYIANGIDGAAVTGITIDDPTLLINVSVPTIGLQSIYAYETYWLSTSAGILDEGRIITAPDTANYIFEGGWKIKNISSPSSPLTITGGYMVDATTGIAASLIDNTGGTIILAPDHVIPYATGSGVTPQDKIDIADAVLAAAQTSPIQADIRKVNDITVDGAGTEADPFGPA